MIDNTSYPIDVIFKYAYFIPTGGIRLQAMMCTVFLACSLACNGHEILVWRRDAVYGRWQI